MGSQLCVKIHTLESTKYLEINVSSIYHHMLDIGEAAFRGKSMILYALIIRYESWKMNELKHPTYFV